MLNRSRLLTAAAFTALMFTSACFGPDAEVPDTVLIDPADIVWAQDGSDLTADPDVTFGQLENGMRYILMHNETPKETAAIRMRIDSGSTNETDNQSGLSHFLEHMAFNGSTNVPEGEMVKLLERNGLAFGADTNAFTSFDQIQYQLDLPSVDDEMLDTGLFIMRETASELLLDIEAIDKERGVIASEERLRNSAGLRNFIHEAEFLIPDTIIHDRLPIGDLDVIANAPRTRFTEIYNGYYRPERTTLVITGDFDVTDMQARITEKFGTWEPVGDAGSDVALGSVDTTRLPDASFFYDPDIPTVISINYVVPHVVYADTAETRRTDLLDSIANGIVTRRLTKISRGEDSPVVNASSNYSSYFDAADVASMDLTATPDTWEAALALGEQEMRRAVEHGFTQGELNEQIANIRTSLENGVEQADTRESTRLANALAGSVNNDRVFTTPASSLARFESYVDEITVEAVHAAYVAQWQGANPLIHMSNNVEIEDVTAKMLAAYTASTEVEVAPPVDTGPLEFAYTDFGTPGEIVSDTRIDDLGIRTLVFANNVRLNIKATDFEDGVVRTSLRFGAGGLEMPRDIDGLNVLMSNYFAEGGLEAHSLDELETILAGRTVTAHIGMGNDYFGTYTSTTPDDLALQMQVWAALVTAPGYRPEGDAQWRQIIGVFYPTLDAEPSGIVTRDVDRITHGGDVRFGLGSEADLTARNYTELKAAVSRAFTEGAMEIAIVGDIDEQAAIDAVAATFGALPTRRAEIMTFEGATDVSFPADRTPLTLEHEGLANKSLAITYWPTVDDSDFRTDIVLDLLAEVMSLKATDVLREELGATYSPQVWSTTSSLYPGYGYITARANVEPQDVETIYTALTGITTSMREGGISEDDLLRARKPILEGIEENLEDNGYWLFVADNAQTKPDRLDRTRTVADMYKSVTTDDLIAMANFYLTDAAALRIRIISDKAE
ncbi:MAG: insulinase family protein [Hyphomonadaceae bacterium]